METNLDKMAAGDLLYLVGVGGGYQPPVLKRMVPLSYFKSR